MVTRMKRRYIHCWKKLDLNIQKDSVSNYGNVGLGTSNLMSMACEMLLNQDN